MARPRKQGIEYFSLDVILDDKFHLIEAQHGITGFGVLIKMYQKIYSEGYCYEWTEREQLLFSSLISVDKNKVMDIINDAIKWGIFDSDIYDKYKVLTSRGIQSRYVAVTYKRAAVEMEKGHLLIDVSDRSNITLTGVSDIQNKGTSKDTDSPSTQSKVKESKVKDIKEINVPAEAEDEPSVPKNDYRYLEDSTEYKAAVYLRSQILEFNPTCKTPSDNIKDLQVWADTIRLTLERDGRTKDDLREVIKYIFHNPEGEFWRPNVQSPTSLRKHWDKIYGQMIQANKPKKNKRGKATTLNNMQGRDDWNFEEIAELENERLKRNIGDTEGLDNEELKRRLRVVEGGAS